MKNYMILGLLCVVAAQAFGIEPVQRAINEAANRGTLRGVENCMDYSKSELLSNDAIKAKCVQTFHRRLYDGDVASGQAGPRIDEGKVGWGGFFENKTPDHVTTWVQIAVTLFDADGEEQEVIGETSIWIDPMGRAEFRVELPNLKPEQFDSIEYCDPDIEKPKGCVGWHITDIMGLTI